MKITSYITGSFIRAFFLALASALVGNVLLTFVGRMVSVPPETFGPYMYSIVIGLTVLGIFAAAVVYIALRSWYGDRAKADRSFIIVSVIALIVSMYPDLAMPWSTDPDQIGWTYGIIANLMLMHVVAALPVMYFFTHAKE